MELAQAPSGHLALVADGDVSAIHAGGTRHRLPANDPTGADGKTGIDAPIRIGVVRIKNRLVKPAMSEQLGDRHNNPRGAELAALYRRWAEGGIGLMITGNIMVDRNALAGPGNVVLDEQSDIEQFRIWLRGAKRNSARLFAQLNHPGKQVPKFLGLQPMAPSPVPAGGPLASDFSPPREMTVLDIERVIEQFAMAARLAKAIGFDGLQLHGAHGYLINQFLSPTHNKRKDKWGAPSRFVSEVYRAVRKEVGDDYPIIIKLNSSDFEKSGNAENDAIAIMLQMEQDGIDAIEISGGTCQSQAMMDDGEARGGYFVEFVRFAKGRLDVPVLASGGFHARANILAALDDVVDMVGIGRALILDPDMPIKIMRGDASDFQSDMRRSAWKYVDTISMLSWFEIQMLRIAHGQQPEPEMHVAGAAWHALRHVGR